MASERFSITGDTEEEPDTVTVPLNPEAVYSVILSMEYILHQ